MDLLLRHVWVLFLIGTFVRVYQFRRAGRPLWVVDADTAAEYSKLVRLFLIVGCIPWLIMGVGDVSGGTVRIFDYLDPRALNPFVLLFHASALAIWASGCIWIFGGNGASFLSRHFTLGNPNHRPGLFSVTPTVVKLLWCALVLSGVVFEILVWCRCLFPYDNAPSSVA